MLSRIQTSVCHGVEGKIVYAESDIKSGLPGMNIVGLASTTIMESKERIKAAIVNSGYLFPRGKITVNLTPADLRKNGSHFDLPIAIGLLTSSMFVDIGRVKEFGLVGELSLDGDVLGVDGVLPMAIGMYEAGIKKIIVPRDNYAEASLISGAKIIVADNLRNCVDIINGEIPEEEFTMGERIKMISNPLNLDFSDIKGQENAKRAITIAVAGRHGLLMVGSPGCGKSMIAKRIPTIMPKMNEREIIETAIIYSISGNNKGKEILIDRPYRNPSKTIGRAGLLGGGHSYARPGEISLAHNGILFLDEVCEFDRDIIESLRNPVEDKLITHFRNGQQYTYPCNFQLIMAANPCKCGYYGDPNHICKCTQAQIEQYNRKLSGPMMDRVDIKLLMERVTYNQFSDDKCITSAQMLKEVLTGINFAERMGRNKFNADLTEAEINEYCELGKKENTLMKRAYEGLHLSPRSYGKVLKVSRTIADISESERIQEEHIAEALSYRFGDYERGER